jgi:hypothetical protein
MRALLCMSAGRDPKPTCNERTTFDVWSHHPYTEGGPTHHAKSGDNVSLGDLPKMRRLLDAAIAAGHVRSQGKPRFWVTEFSWDSKPPDPKGVPSALHARWVAEALFRMWDAGISLVTWFTIRDQPLADGPYQSGLYLFGTRATYGPPKLARTAFRFPFVAFSTSKGASFWGRTPTSSGGRVAIEARKGAGWTTLHVAKADRYGIFQGRVDVPAKVTLLRARVASSGQVSLGFSLRRPPDRTVLVFGS